MKSSFRMAHWDRMSMTKIYQSLVIVMALIFGSCQKEVSDYPSDNSNPSVSLENASAQSHIDAGPERIVVYPSCTSTTLFGNGSANGLFTFKWTQLSGNSRATITQRNNAKTYVGDLKPGVYTFELTATDKKGNSYRDTTSVSVLEKMTWTINGTTREALVHLPASTESAPVLFAFHGHGGTDLGFAGKGFELEWPQAIVIYPQGLPTKSHEDKNGKMPGWQHSTGEVNSETNTKDQDLQFFDAMLSTLENKYNADQKRVFVHGWSNGGSFVYNVLWTARGNKLAGISSAAATLGTTKGKAPLPAIQIAGKSDPLVPFKYQQQSMQKVSTLNQCYADGYLWGQGENDLTAIRYRSALHKPVLFLQYNGGHSYPSDVDPLIVKFFREMSWRITH